MKSSFGVGRDYFLREEKVVLQLIFWSHLCRMLCTMYDLYKKKNIDKSGFRFYPLAIISWSVLPCSPLGRVVYIGKWQNNCMHRFTFQFLPF